MSRPQPTLICSHGVGDRMIEVCEADAVYAVLYDGKPVKLRSINPAARYQGYKYNKSMFPEPGHAIALARRLNEAHATDAFTVAVMQPHRILP